MSDDDCPGANLCHGCMKWCDNCGDVAHICDARLRGEPCDQHPIPHPRDVLEARRRFWEHELFEGKEKVRTATNGLELLHDDEVARRHYVKQLIELEALELSEAAETAERRQLREGMDAAYAEERRAACWGYGTVYVEPLVKCVTCGETIALAKPADDLPAGTYIHATGDVSRDCDLNGDHEPEP